MSSSYRPDSGSLSTNYMESCTGIVLKLYFYIQRDCVFCSLGIAVIQPDSGIEIRDAWIFSRCVSPMAEAGYFGSPEMNGARNQ